MSGLDELDSANPASELIDAIWKVRERSFRDSHERIAVLAKHDDPVVREEALSLLLTKWVDTRYRDLAADALVHDPDFGVRGRAAIGLASVSVRDTRVDDIWLLARTLRDPAEEPEVVRAAYTALLLLGREQRLPRITQPFRPDVHVNWAWVAEFLRSELPEGDPGE